MTKALPQTKSTNKGDLCLTKELQKLYIHKGNRLVFTNGMTLNKLALEIWEELGESDIDSSVVSRVIKGERLFSFRQLAVFCNVLDVPQSERNLLFSLLEREILKREGDPLVRGGWNIWEEVFNKSKEGKSSKINLRFVRSAYYQLMSDGLSLKNLKKQLPGNYSVRIPVCGFSKTSSDFDSNCHCGYHLALYGVIKRCLARKFSKKEIENEVNSWINYFFPSGSLVPVVK